MQKVNIETARANSIHDSQHDQIDKIFISRFALRETVYLKTDIEQKARLITAIKFKGDGGCVYALACGMDESEHYDFEVSETKDILIATI